MKRILLRSISSAALLLATTFAFTSCDSTDNPDNTSFSLTDNGVFILNEGNFGTPNGSISYYHKVSGELMLDVFGKSNSGQLLGDVVQSMHFFDKRYFIVVNNSNKIEVVDHETFSSKGVIQNLKSPRYFVALNQDKGYVSEWVTYGDQGQVSVINLKTNTVVKSISVGFMPEQILFSKGKLYVTNSGDNTISVINTSTDIVEKTLQVTDGPSELVQDKDNNIWILSAGNIVYTSDWSAIDYEKTTPGAITKLNTTTNSIETTFKLPSNRSIPKNLSIDETRSKLYFNYQDKTYVQPITASELSLQVVINRGFYGMEVDPASGHIYGSDENNFTGDGTVLIYNTDGQKLKEFKAGIAPNGFVFN